MDSVFSDLLEAKRQCLLADRLLEQTYPILRDPHLLVSVLMHLSSSLTCVVLALGKKHAIDVSSYVLSSPHDLLTCVKEMMAPELEVVKKHIPLFEEISSLMQAYKESPVTFSRKDSYVICDDVYTLEILDVSRLKSLVRGLRIFCDEIMPRAL